MYIDRSIGFEEYPFKGIFTRAFIDESKPLDEREEETITVLETPCDIQEASHNTPNNFIKASFEVFFPIKASVPVKNGDAFSADFMGVDVKGRVTGVFPSTLGGCKCYIDDTDI